MANERRKYIKKGGVKEKRKQDTCMLHGRRDARRENEVRGGMRNFEQGRKRMKAAATWRKCDG